MAYNNFNSHTREGVTLLYKCNDPATYFNSHTREGVTYISSNYISFFEFQLTHP